MSTVRLFSFCPGFGWDGVNFPPSSCCVLDLVRDECWEHCYNCFQFLLWNQELFPVCHVQLTHRCAGAGREHSPAASPGWPVETFHTWTSCSVYEWGLAGGKESAFLSSTSLNFSGSLVSFVSFAKFSKWKSSRFCGCCSGTGYVLVVGQWENCVTCHPVCWLVK